MPNIACPTLVITTEDSGLASVEETRAWQKTMPDSRLLVLPGNSYHVAATDPDAAARNAGIHRRRPDLAPGFSVIRPGHRRLSKAASLALALGCLSAAAVTAVSGAQRAPVDPRVVLTAEAHHDTSPALAALATTPVPHVGAIVREPHRAVRTTPAAADPVVQASATVPARARVVLNATGLGNDYGHGYQVGSLPPDTVGAVGRTQYVQWVNSSLVVLDKRTGRQLANPMDGNVLWKGFGGACEKSNSGDPVVNYDRMAHRWVLQQFAVDAAPYLECFAISTSENALGSYHRYSFGYGGGFNDYPKAGVWSHSYVDTYNMFGDTAEDPTGPRVCAFNRLAMLAGRTAHQACVQLPSGSGLLLPADVDGTRTPGMTEDVPVLRLATNALEVLAFHVDWQHVGADRLSAASKIPVAAFTPACGELYAIAERNAAPCAPQPGSGVAGQFALVGLDVLSDRPMFRLAWRRFGDGHDAMVVTHAVDAQPRAAVAVRWYELRRTGRGRWSTYQQGTYAPDGDSRWMSSAAMDKNGGIAVGYSVSGPTLTFPSIRIAGRSAKDPKGTLSRETSIAEGSGEQLTASNVARWGDYSAMTVDPVDDCTLWFTTEYMKATGLFSWSTRVAAVRLPGC